MEEKHGYNQPIEAEPATEAERARIFDQLLPHISTNRCVSFDGETRRGQKKSWRQLELPFVKSGE